MSLFPAESRSKDTASVVQGVVRAVQDPAGAFERASAAVKSRNLGDDLVGAAKGAVQAANLATGNAIDQVKTVYGAVKDLVNPSQTVAGKQVSLIDSLIGEIAGAYGGKAPATTTPSNSLSQWGNLSSHLIARMYPCDSSGREIFGSNGLATDIRGPITEANFEATWNWQSPFENSGPESKAPALMAMLQTGQLATVANALQSVMPSGPVGDYLGDAAGKAAAYAKQLEGRTGITKLNSRQVFSGMPPIKVTMTLHFRAVTDAETEVMQPYQQLLRWANPQKLAKDGILAEVITNGSKDFIKALFPSISPQMVGFSYGNNRYSPMVIESMGNPIDGPMGADGRPIYRAVQITLATLTALDKNDVAGLFRRGAA